MRTYRTNVRSTPTGLRISIAIYDGGMLRRRTPWRSYVPFDPIDPILEENGIPIAVSKRTDPIGLPLQMRDIEIGK